MKVSTKQTLSERNKNENCYHVMLRGCSFYDFIFPNLCLRAIYSEDWNIIIPLTILFCNSLMNPVIYLTFTWRKIYNTFKTILPRCCDRYATGPTGTDIRDTETVSNETNNSKDDSIDFIKPEKVPISLDNVHLTSN